MTSSRKKQPQPTALDSFITNQADVLARRQEPDTEKDPDMVSSSLKAAAAARKDKTSAKKKKPHAPPPH